MKEVNKYIEELLYRHQCVIIPEFGAFISNRKSAVISEDKTFSPPSKMLTFNSRLTSNDGLLIKHISETEKITYEAAQSKVHLSVEKWKKELASGEIVKFDNVGILQQNAEGKIAFSPSDGKNLLTDSFGMSSFVPQEADKAQEEKQPPVVTAPLLDKDPKSKKAQKPSGDQQEKKKSRGFLKYAAIAVLGLVAVSYGAFSYFGSDNDSNNVADNDSAQKQIENHISEATFLSGTPLELPSVPLNVVKGEENKIEAVESPVVNTPEENVVAVEKKETKKTPPAEKAKTAPVEEVTKLSPDMKFHVIAGAFKSEANAKTRVKQLKKKGYKAAIVGKNSRGLYQVCYQSFKTQSEAEEFSKDIKNNKKLDSWILETK